MMVGAQGHPAAIRPAGSAGEEPVMGSKRTASRYSFARSYEREIVIVPCIETTFL